MKTNSYIIADSSGLISLLALNDSNHRKAKQIAETIFKNHQNIILPYEIFAETMNVMGKKFNKSETLLAANLLFDYQTTGTVIFPNSTPQILILTIDRFNKLKNSISFTDCLVMAYADEFETKEIFGFDEAFAKNGYILPGSK